MRFGGSAAALVALARHVRPGGRLLYGDGCWERPPAPDAAALFNDVLGLPVIVGHALEAGWRLLYLSTADQREWDDFESTWRLGREEWLLAHQADAAASDLRHKLNVRVEEYTNIYRGTLGFCYLVLGR